MTTTNSHPLALVAELTHRCPLHCVYCSNPEELIRRENELSTDDWIRVLNEAAALGVLQADFTGGEPLARPDLVELVRAARAAGLYASLITSGMPLDEKRLTDLVSAGLDHFQLSFQGAHEINADEFAGTHAHSTKLKVAEWVKKHRIGFTLNFVIHRQNLAHLEAMLQLTEQIAPGRAEFAHVQYYGWAFANLDRLMPTREQLDCSLELLQRAEERLRGQIKIEYVVPDYYAKYPKACMGGWGRKVALITPAGEVLPCHAAKIMPAMQFDNVKQRSLRDIWENSTAFQRFRGEHWMPEPCRSCDRRTIDFGGCRCQAMLLVHNPATTDPVCSLAPDRHVVDEILQRVNAAPAAAAPHTSEWIYRKNP